MTPIKTGEHELLACVVPEDAHSFEIGSNNVDYGDTVMFLRGTPDYACCNTALLPYDPGNWQIIGIISSTEMLSEEVCREICESWNCYGTAYKNYAMGYYCYETAQESFLSLLEANGCTVRNPLPPFDLKTVHEWADNQSKLQRYLILRKV